MKIQVNNSHLVVFESALFKTTTTLIIGLENLILIDPNWLPQEIDFIAKFIDKIKEAKKLFLFFTHSDYDHIIGYGAFKEFETIASLNFTNNPKKEETLSQIRSFDDSYYISRRYKIEYPQIQNIIDGDRQALTFGNDVYMFWQAVGHNPDGLLLLDIQHKVLIVGDYMSNVEFPYIYTSIKEYKNTLSKIDSIISEYDIQFLISGHGDYTDSKGEMRNRLSASRAYISQIEYCIKNSIEFNFQKFINDYDFPIIMKQFHDGNISLAKKEFNR